VTDKNRRQALIHYFGREKFKDTGAERGLDLCVALAGGRTLKAKPVTVRDPEDGRRWTFTPDRLITLPITLPFYGYADGLTHQTPRGRKKDLWENALLRTKGTRVFRSDSQLLENPKWHQYVAGKLLDFSRSEFPDVQLYA
jgi:hypothetical protein